MIFLTDDYENQRKSFFSVFTTISRKKMFRNIYNLNIYGVRRTQIKIFLKIKRNLYL